jgi:ribulose-phosphate 3-epimerase
VDIVDKTMSEDAEDVKTYRLETMKAYWPNTQVQTHIMSYKPAQWLDQVLPYSDVVYIHAECQDDIEPLIEKIKQSGKKAGIALTMWTKPEEIETLLKKVDYVLLLTISKPGSSGQKFDILGLDRIKQINNLSFRNQFILCVDGGVNENIITMLEVENIVSGSSVLKNANPKRQIMRLQTVGRYEAT